LIFGKVFVSKGATFERPIMNYASLWEIAAVKAWLPVKAIAAESDGLLVSSHKAYRGR